MTADAERLAAIQERCEKVQGPWFRDGRDVFSEREPSETSHDIATHVWDEHHAEFIAHAPEDIVYLLTLNETDAIQAAETLVVALRDLRQAEAERDALRARIAAIESAARDTIAQWEKTDDDDLTDAQYGERGYALGVLAALAVDQPVAAPEPDDIPGGCIYCSSSGIVEDYEGDRPCSACDGTGTPRLREATPEPGISTLVLLDTETCRVEWEATPEPPHLDPEPYVDQWGSQRSPDGDSAGYDFDTVFHFEPREGYSKNREDYPSHG